MASALTTILGSVVLSGKYLEHLFTAAFWRNCHSSWGQMMISTAGECLEGHEQGYLLLQSLPLNTGFLQLDCRILSALLPMQASPQAKAHAALVHCLHIC